VSPGGTPDMPKISISMESRPSLALGTLHAHREHEDWVRMRTNMHARMSGQLMGHSLFKAGLVDLVAVCG